MRDKRSQERDERSSPSRCEDVLQGTLQGLGLARVIHSLALLKAWDRAVAPRVRERATVESFRDGRLYLLVDDPIWLHELHMLRHKLKTVLNEELRAPVVSEIVLRIGRAPRPGIRQMLHSRTQGARAIPMEAEATIKQVLTPLRGLPCEEALERLLRRSAARLG